MNVLNTLLNSILNLVFPEKCLFCGLPGADLCIACISNLPEAKRESADWIFPLYDYRHPPIKQALALFKYKGKKNLAGIFAEVLYDRILEELSELSVMKNFTNVILIPIPLSRKRYRERGYNQAELICKELIKINNLRHGVDSKNKFNLENNILIKPKEILKKAGARKVIAFTVAH